ncbi:hypothetical protein [Microbacterium sp. 18062]|uniref:hypothetical protein n=1 Tax=Microbacterium sp. 18062 TaxID=2681410 RepID=UPI00135A37FD|nr:hypothetical protein [Microbacterium sp. 18062]
MDGTLDILLETFTWVGFGAGMVLAGIALVAALADGTWLPASAVVEPGPDGRVARWFTHDGGVGEALLSASDELHLGAADSVHLFYRPGSNRIRFTPRSPLVRVTGWLAVGLLAIGALSLIASLIIMFASA